jgi:integrase
MIFDIPRRRLQYHRENVKAAQRMLGHASDQITLDRYSHLYDADLEDLSDSMDARYGAAQTRIGRHPHAEGAAKKRAA